jgi:hypothetical protein
VILDVLSQVDYFAVVFAAVAGLAVGTVWYLPAVFGRQWQASLARSEQRRQGPLPLLRETKLVRRAPLR